MNKKKQKQLSKMLSNVGDMSFKARVKTVVNWLDIKEEDKILDCGCGEGFYLKILSELYPKTTFYGIDYDNKILKRAKQELGKKAVIKKEDIYKTSFKKNYFDKIILSEVLEHLNKDLLALNKIKAILKPKGTLLITVPNANYPFFWDPLNKILEILFNTHVESGFWAGVWNMHERLYYPQEIIKLCQKAKLKIEKTRFLVHYCFPFNHIFLYAFKQILNKGFFSKNSSQAADKFTWEKGRGVSKYNWVKLGYRFLNWIDSFNKKDFSKDISTVSIAIKLSKI